MTGTENLNNSGKAENRKISYLRLSITDRCNLRCVYCMPQDGVQFIPHEKILTYEEMLYLVEIATQIGIRKVRITGGEPLVRKGIIHFLSKLSAIKKIEELTLTTNGVLLGKYASSLKECGINRVNISMDTLDREKFNAITQCDCFDQVWDGISKAEELGFHPIKINVVAMNGVNDDEIIDFARLTLEKKYHIRFIEYMPIGAGNKWTRTKFIPSDEILERIGVLGKLIPINSYNNDIHSNDGPAVRYRIDGAKGEIGVISALSNHFCSNCNRLRLTPEGHLRGCLFSDQEIDLMTPVRNGEPESQILELMKRAIKNKPENHSLMDPEPRKCGRRMFSIGG